MPMRMAAIGSDYALASAERFEALGRVEAMSSAMTLGGARGATYSRQDALLHRLRGQLEIGMPVSVGEASIRPNLSFCYRRERGKTVTAGRGSLPATVVQLGARAFEIAGGTTLDARDLRALFGFRSGLRDNGVAAGPARYRLSATRDRGLDGLGVVLSLGVGNGSGTEASLDPFSQSAFDAGGTASVADRDVVANARVGYGLDFGRASRLSAHAQFDGSSVAIGVDRNGDLGSAGLTFGSTTTSASGAPGGATPGFRGALGLGVELRY